MSNITKHKTHVHAVAVYTEYKHIDIHSMSFLKGKIGNFK